MIAPGERPLPDEALGMMPLQTIARCALPSDKVGGKVCACLLVGLLAFSGCSSLSGGSSSVADNRLPRNAEEALGQVPSGPDGIEGPTERRLKADRWNRERQMQNDPRMMQALAEYDAAKQLFDRGQFSEAEKSFKALAKERRETYENWGDRWRRAWGVRDETDTANLKRYGDPIEEDSMFMLAECQFKQRRYSYAQDSYDALLEKYPSTRHLEDSTHRLLSIGMYWLGFSAESDLNGEIRLAGGSTVKPPSGPSIPIVPNVTDRTRPVFDTRGRALQALRSVWLHDASGNLADDALMVSANHNLRTGDFVEAARLYKLLREQYPDSPHFQDAHLLGAHVTMASYEGAEYDGSPLNEASNLKKMALAAFPNMSAEEQETLRAEIARLDSERVRRLWKNVEYYEAKKQPESMAVYCNRIINQHSDSEYAEKARQMLRAIQAGQYDKKSIFGRTPVRKAPVPTSPPVEPPPRTMDEPVDASEVLLDEN